MAFYKNFESKSPAQRRSDAFARGGFDNEGTHYRKSPSGHSAAKPYNGKGEHRQDRNPQQGYSANGRNDSSRGGYHSSNPGKPQAGGYHGGFQGNTQNRHPGGSNPQSRPAANAPRSGYNTRNPEPRQQAPDRRYNAQPTPNKGFEQYRYNPQPKPQPRMEPAKPGILNTISHVLADAVEEINENLLTGRNPIREAIKTGRDIERLLVARGELSGSAREIVEMARERHIPIQEVERARLDSITRNHQGMLAYASAYHYSNLDDMFALAARRDEPPFLILLDRITDPHNLGAIIRSAECAGAHGVIVQERRAVGLTPAAVKASAGAIEHLPVARVTNLSNTIEYLKKRGIWVYAADMGGQDYATVDLTGPIALVIGAEGNGVGSRVMQECDRIISLPMHGHIDSLNASVAAGVLMYAVRNARS